MKDWPNYEIYHTHELEKALKDINEAENPDEATHIRMLLEKGGYKNIEGTVEDTNKAIMKGADPKYIIFRVIFIIGSFFYAYSKYKSGSDLTTAYIFFALGLIWSASTAIHFYIAFKAKSADITSS